jgi:hypothetical protein
VLDFLFVGRGGVARLGLSVGSALVTLFLATACTGSSAPQPVPSSPAATTPAETPAAALQRLAGLAARVNYTATYAVRQTHPAGSATWRVWRAPAKLRVDVTRGKVTATLIVTPKASFSCHRAGRQRTCLRVAGAGKPVPAPLQLLAQRVFSGDLDTLAGALTSYDVTTAAAQEGNALVPASTCFAVTPHAKAPKSHVDKATYCFSAAGVLTSVVYPSGNAVRLQHVSLTTPSHQSFVPYSSPTPLPGS